MKYIIVGSEKADPYVGKIFNESPLGKALLGKKQGAIVKGNVADGIVKYKIVNI